MHGFGATKAAWLATHKQAPGFIKGTAFLPMVNTADGKHPKYAAVQLSTPVVSYTINLPARTSYRQARQIAADEFPADARLGKATRPDRTCKLVRVVSPTLSHAVARYGYTKKWKFAVEFESRGGAASYDPSNLSDLLFAAVPPGMRLRRC